MSAATQRSAPPPVMSIVPPEAIAPKLLEQVRAAETAIAEGEARIGTLVLAEMRGEKGATAALAELEATIAATRADHAKKNAAWKAALAADRAALEAHQEWIRTLPAEVLVAGITSRKCADLCHEGGCALMGGTIPCAHPRVALPPKHVGDRFISTNRVAASREIMRQREAEENADQ